MTVRDYVTVHDAGRVLHPALAEGQVLGGLAHGLGAALLERHVYDDAGNLLTSTFVDYPTPTATELPRPTTAMAETPSPVTPLGAKGLGEGTTMSAPAAVANAVADALGLDRLDTEVDLELPLTPARVRALMQAARSSPLPDAEPTAGPALGGVDEPGPPHPGSREAAAVPVRAAGNGGGSARPPGRARRRGPAAGRRPEPGPDAQPPAGRPRRGRRPQRAGRVRRPGRIRRAGSGRRPPWTGRSGRHRRGSRRRRPHPAAAPGVLLDARGIGALADGLPLVGHVATRNRGTVGGSIAHGDPAAELPLALLALGGSVVVEGRDGRRDIPADELFAGFLTTTLRPGELLLAVRFPTPRAGEGSTLLEVAQRHGDFPLAAVAVSLRLDAEGKVGDARVAVGAVADRPLLLTGAAEALVAGAAAGRGRPAGRDPGRRPRLPPRSR